MLFSKNILAILAATVVGVSANKCSNEQEQKAVCCSAVVGGVCLNVISVGGGSCRQGQVLACCPKNTGKGFINVSPCFAIGA